jgi:hypothetical protein
MLHAHAPQATSLCSSLRRALYNHEFLLPARPGSKKVDHFTPLPPRHQQLPVPYPRAIQIANF